MNITGEPQTANPATTSRGGPNAQRASRSRNLETRPKKVVVSANVERRRADEANARPPPKLTVLEQPQRLGRGDENVVRLRGLVQAALGDLHDLLEGLDLGKPSSAQKRAVRTDRGGPLSQLAFSDEQKQGRVS